MVLIQNQQKCFQGLKWINKRQFFSEKSCLAKGSIPSNLSTALTKQFSAGSGESENEIDKPLTWKGKVTFLAFLPPASK